MTKTERLNELIDAAIRDVPFGAIGLGYLRYEAVRKLNMVGLYSLCIRRNEGEDFDGMVDSMILDGLTSGKDQAG